jgi:hypothetical protein
MIEIWRKFFGGIKEIWNEIGKRGQLAVVLGFISSIVWTAFAIYETFSAQGCKAMVSFSHYFGPGLAALFLMFIMATTASILWWLILSIPTGAKNLGEYLRNRREHIERGDYDSVASRKKTFSFVSFFVSLAALIAVCGYLLGYLAWVVFC